MVATLTDKRLTHSQIQTMQTCSRKHYLAYVEGIRRDMDEAPLRIGSTVHLAIDLYNQGVENPIREALAEYDKTNHDENGYEREMILVILDEYFAFWKEQDADIEIIETEKAFQIPLYNPATNGMSRTFKLAGKIDAIVRLADGKVAIMEHKTTGSDIDDDSPYWQRLSIDNQISTYYLAALHLEHPVQTVLYNVIRKPALRPGQRPELDAEGKKIVVCKTTGERLLKRAGGWKQSVTNSKSEQMLTQPETLEEYGDRVSQAIRENPAKYFQRRRIPRLDSDLRETAYALWRNAEKIREESRAGIWPRSDSACFRFNKPCPYFSLCTTGFDPDRDELPIGFKRVEDIHQELSEE